MNIKVETLIKISNALDVTIDTLLRNFLGNNNDLYTLEINRYIEMLSEEEKARFLWHLQKSKEFDETWTHRWTFENDNKSDSIGIL